MLFADKAQLIKVFQVSSKEKFQPLDCAEFSVVR